MLARAGYLLGRSSGARPAIDFNFTNGALPSGLTYTRASAATNSLYTDAAGSAFNSYTTDVAAFVSGGMLRFNARTNLLLNSAAPVTQTTASLGTGTYVFWCIGTGTVVSSAGTATASGLGSITGSQGTFQTITVTVAGTLTFTVSGSINRFQLEAGTYPSPFITTTGTTATRAGDTLVLAASGTPFAAGLGTVIVQTRNAKNVSGSGRLIITVGQGNYLGIQADTQTFAGTSGTLIATAGSGAFSTGLARAGLAFDAAGFASSLNGGTVVTNAEAAALSGSIFIGSLSNATQVIDGLLARMSVWNTKLPSATVRALTGTGAY